MEEATIRKFRIVHTEGNRQVSHEVAYYNLQMIIAVGFKVNNERAVQFRKWANGIVKDYIIKGWVMDDTRLKNGTYLTEKYFDEQLERIREIRASERKFYQKVTDLYATAMDYNLNAVATKRFYATVQNKKPKSPSYMRKQSLRSIVSFKTVSFSQTLTGLCLSWKKNLKIKEKKKIMKLGIEKSPKMLEIL